MLQKVIVFDVQVYKVYKKHELPILSNFSREISKGKYSSKLHGSCEEAPLLPPERIHAITRFSKLNTAVLGKALVTSLHYNQLE